jgi:PAS domain S-box-containing protein
MKDGLSLYRWFRNVSIARKLYFTVGTMALLIGVELFVLLFCLNTLSSLRAYVGGEGLWSKAQKDAAFHLYKYGVSRTEKDYELFEQFMRIPLGDAKARRELLMNDRNMDVARDGLLEGRNHPDDINGMIRLFIDFHNVYYIRKAINIWGEAQSIAMQLPPIAKELREEINSQNPSQEKISGLLVHIYIIDENLTTFEDEFSFTLGEGSRWLEKVVLRLLFIMAITVETTGLLLVISITRGIQTGLTDIIRAADSFSTGSLSTRAKVSSHDEIGVVANSFNEMADNLQRRVRELGQLNQHLSHEIGERQRAEMVLRRMNETLEVRVTERTATLTHLVDALRKEAADRKRAEAALRQVVESAPNAMVMIQANGNIGMVNAQTERMFGYSRDELLDKSVEMLTPERFRGQHPKLRSSFFAKPVSRPMGAGRDLYGLRKDGHEFPIEIGLNPIETDEGIKVLSAIVDISDHKQKEERIESALKEKEILLAEIHHRVKNNLQVVSSLLDIEIDRLKDPAVLDVLRESQNRIRSMALIHQTLYESQDFAQVDFGDFLHSMAPTLVSSYGVDPGRITLSIDAVGVQLPINTAIPCGLVVNELISNALKHAFPDSRPGEIMIRLARDSESHALLSVTDNGNGIPEDLDLLGTETLGWQLVNLLTEQLGGSIEINRANPTVLALRFPI